MRFLTTLTLAAALAAPLFAQDHDASPMPAKPPVPPSKSLTVTIEGRVRTFSVEDLINLPQHTVHVFNAHRQKEETYAGPLLSDVLAQSGLTASRETESMILISSIIATGTDKYFVLYSAAEVEPMFSKSQVIVAITKNNGLPNDEGGLIQLINTDGAKPARWVHGLANINVMSVHQN